VGFSAANIEGGALSEKARPDRPKNRFFKGLIAGNRAGFCPQNLDFGRIEARLRGKCGPDWPAPDSRNQRF
jgi:hypothetical protein